MAWLFTLILWWPQGRASSSTLHISEVRCAGALNESNEATFYSDSRERARSLIKWWALQLHIFVIYLGPSLDGLGLKRRAGLVSEIVFPTLILDGSSAVKTANFVFTVEAKACRQSTNPSNGVHRTSRSVSGVMGTTSQLSLVVQKVTCYLSYSSVQGW